MFGYKSIKACFFKQKAAHGNKGLGGKAIIPVFFAVAVSQNTLAVLGDLYNVYLSDGLTRSCGYKPVIGVGLLLGFHHGP